MIFSDKEKALRKEDLEIFQRFAKSQRKEMMWW